MHGGLGGLLVLRAGRRRRRPDSASPRALLGELRALQPGWHTARQRKYRLYSQSLGSVDRSTARINSAAFPGHACTSTLLVLGVASHGAVGIRLISTAKQAQGAPNCVPRLCAAEVYALIGAPSRDDVAGKRARIARSELPRQTAPCPSCTLRETPRHLGTSDCLEPCHGPCHGCPSLATGLATGARALPRSKKAWLRWRRVLRRHGVLGVSFPGVDVLVDTGRQSKVPRCLGVSEVPPDQVHRVGLAVEQGVETRAEDDTQRTGRCRARLHGTPRGGHALGAFARVPTANAR